MGVTIRWIDPVRHEVRVEHMRGTTQDALRRIRGNMGPQPLHDFDCVGSVIDHETDYEREILSQKGVGK
jgi:hypothetical protein